MDGAKLESEKIRRQMTIFAARIKQSKAAPERLKELGAERSKALSVVRAWNWSDANHQYHEALDLKKKAWLDSSVVRVRARIRQKEDSLKDIIDGKARTADEVWAAMIPSRWRTYKISMPSKRATSRTVRCSTSWAI